MSPARSSRPVTSDARSTGSGREIPAATVARLPVYHRVLQGLVDAGISTVSSHDLARSCGVSSAKLRKDLSHLGSYGTRGVGYDVEFLTYQIARELGLATAWGVVVVGAGNLGQALVSYRGFASRGFAVVGLLDIDPEVIGRCFGSADEPITVRSLADLGQIVASGSAQIGVISTPADAAQEVCDRLVAAGIRSIVNFAPVVLDVPEDVEVRKVDLAVELQILAFHEQRRQAPHDPSMAAPSLGEAI